MPTYDYECDACGHAFEKFQSIKAPSIRRCPSCGRMKVRRLIGPGAGIIFKGSGFYQTDYRSDAYRKAAEKDKPAESSDKTKGKDKGQGEGKDKTTPKSGAGKSSAEAGGGD